MLENRMPQDIAMRYLSVLDGSDDQKRAALLAERLKHWKSLTNA